MIFKQKFISLFSLIMFVCLTVTGCGGKKEPPVSSGTAAGSDRWAAEPFAMPQYLATDGELISDNNLFYYAYSETEQMIEKIGLYRKDLNDLQAEPIEIPGVFAADTNETPVWMAAGADGTLSLLTYHSNGAQEEQDNGAQEEQDNGAQEEQDSGAQEEQNNDAQEEQDNDAREERNNGAQEEQDNDAREEQNNSAQEEQDNGAQGDQNNEDVNEDGADGAAAISDITWKRIDQSGTLLASGSIMEYFIQADAGMPLPYGMAVDAEGNLYFYRGAQLVVVDSSGALLADMMVQGDIDKLITDRDGRVYTVITNMDNAIRMEVSAIDWGQKTLTGTYALPDDKYFFDIIAGMEHNWLLVLEEGIYDYDIETKAATLKLEWSELNLAVDYMGKVLALEDGRMLLINRSYRNNQEESEVLLLRQLTAEEAAEQDARQAEKKTLVVGGLTYSFDGAIREAIVEFNKTHDDFIIEIKSYDDEDMAAGLEQLNTDLISGKAPDIIVLPSTFAIDNYIRQGVLEDLYPYLEGDAAVGMAELQENIVRAFETDGKLYNLPISFHISTIMGARSVIGDRKSWNLEEMMAFAAANSDGSEIFDNAAQSNVLAICLNGSSNQLFGRKAAAAEFDRELLIKMLEFSRQFVPDAQSANDANDILGLVEKIGGGRTLLLENDISDLFNFQVYRTFFNDTVNYVGYPNARGSGNLADTFNLVAMSSQSEDKELVWEFISSLLTEKIQDGNGLYELPIRRSSLEKKITAALDKNITGRIVYGNFQMDLVPLTAEEAAIFRELLASVETRLELDAQVRNIIMEEAAGYFDGSRSAEETADVIVNRVELYLAEMK